MKTTTLTWVSALAMLLTSTAVYALTPSGGFAAVQAKPEQLESARFDVGGAVEAARADFTPGIPTAVPLVNELEVLEKKPPPPVVPAKTPVSSGAPTSQHRNQAAPSTRPSKPRRLPNDAVAQTPLRSEPRAFAASPQQGFSMPLPTSFQSSAPPPQQAPQQAFPAPSSTSSGGKGKR